jgi:ferredoxin
MKTGPRAEAGFDLALTEILEDGRHVFTIEVGSNLGREIVQMLPTAEAGAADLEASARCTERAVQQMGRSMDVEGVPELLARNLEHPRWDDVASRCLACANCTMVCPTCFCNTVEDTTDLTGDHAERWRSWDSCFTMDFSYLHGGSVRTSTRARYRQWLTHKLSTWHDQFGTSGCVGCGRCITWCPVAIDLTQEVAAIRAGVGAHGNNR